MKWTRLFARTIDYFLFYAIFILFEPTFLIKTIIFFLIPPLYAPLEGLFYYFFQTTPGKSIFGIKLSKKLPLQASLKLAFKKAFFILPLLYSPLNIFLLRYYLKESKESQSKRWDLFQGAQVVIVQRKKLFKHVILITLFSLLFFIYTPSSWKNHLILFSKSEITLTDWVEIKDSHLKFSIYFPETPTFTEKEIHVEEKDTKLDVKEYLHDAKVSYSLVSTKIPSSWTLLGSNYLFKALSKPIEEHQGMIVSKKFIKHGKHPAMNYLLKNKGGGQTKGILILVKTTIYKLEVMSKKDLSDDELHSASDFINSFDVN